MPRNADMMKRLRKVVLSASYVDDIELTDANADAIVLAVLEELREPTPEMVEAGRWPAEDDGPAACWRSMIAALARPAAAEGE